MLDVIPGIFEKEWDPIEEKLRLVAPLVDWVQIDIADETLVPNSAWSQYEKFSICSSVKELHHVSLEGHLMVIKPELLIRPLVDVGFKRLIAHVECQDPRLFLDMAKYEHVEVGLAIDGATDLEQIEPFLDQIDTVLVMTIEAGFSGQEFMVEAVEKIRRIHEHFPDLPIEVDGGINQKTAKVAVDAGATRLVSTSFVFRHQAGISQAIEELRSVG